MAELSITPAAIVAVLASPAGCEAALAIDDVTACRIGEGEVMLLGEVLTADAARPVRAADPDAVVLDVSDGWTSFELLGDGARDAFARLSEVELPDEGFVQGQILRVSARVLVHAEGIRLLVPAMWADHVEARIRADAAEVLT